MMRLRVSPDELRAPSIELTGDRYHYVIRVRRLEVGDAVSVFDGAGWRRAHQVTEVSGDGATATLTAAGEATQDDARELEITSILPLIKGERMDWAIEKLTELGVARIALVRASRAVTRLHGDRAARRRDRFERLADAAARQCGRADVPSIEPIDDFGAVLASSTASLKIICHPDGAPLAPQLGVEPVASIALVTGPEGGFDPAELEQAMEAGFALASLGPRILRAETAAIAAATAAGLLLGDLG